MQRLLIPWLVVLNALSSKLIASGEVFVMGSLKNGKNRSMCKKKNRGDLSLLQLILTLANTILGQLQLSKNQHSSVLGQRYHFLLLHSTS